MKNSNINPGQRFFKWTVIKCTGLKVTSDKITGDKHKIVRAMYFLCKCTCGKTKEITAGALQRGRSKQCKDCADSKKKKPFNQLTRERKRQLRRERDGQCFRCCEELIYRSGLCLVHYNAELLRRRIAYKKNIISKLLNNNYYE